MLDMNYVLIITLKYKNYVKTRTNVEKYIKGHNAVDNQVLFS